MKKILYASLLFLNLSLLAQTSDQPSGSGTENDPYLVGTLDDLYWLTQNSSEWDQYYIQTSNIDASSTGTWDEGQPVSAGMYIYTIQAGEFRKTKKMVLLK